MNPFLAKPLRKVQPGAAPLKNSSQEHRPSRYLNPNMTKKPTDRRVLDPQRMKNPSPKQNQKNNNINLVSFNKLLKENTPAEPNKDKEPKKEQKKEQKKELKTEEKKEQKKELKTEEKKENIENIENNSNNNKQNLIIDNNIKINIPNSTDKLIFNNNDEILEYIRNQIKDGKIKNIHQQLEIKKSDFTGFILSKKKEGFTIYEIEIEEDIDKINDSLKKQKVEIKNKPVEIVFSSSKKENITKKDELKKDNEFKNKKNDNLIQAMKNKTMEREIINIKKDKINDEIKNLQNKEKRNAENENDYIRKELERKAIKQTVKPNPQGEPKKMESAGVKFKGKEEDEKSNPTDNANEKLDSQNSIEENQRRATRALARFKKAYSKQNKDEDNKETGNKIQSLAAILQEHIMKPLAEMAQEGTMRPRGGSVECRGIKTKGVVELLENVPVVKKNVKKPKNINFE